MPELAKTYQPSQIEPQVLERWNQERAFAAQPQPDKKPYVIVIPPPNVTAQLHLGHALNNTLQDILIRWHRMMGDNTVWIPGTDHAGIATQTVVEKRVLAEQGKRRTDFQRDEFVKLIQAWKDEYEATITHQLKMMGCSCDFERQRFTMDDICAKAVREAFFRLFKDGLIYRGKRLVNWDPVTQTALADDEVEMEEVDGFFYYLKYEVVDQSGRVTEPSRERGWQAEGPGISGSGQAKDTPSPQPSPEGRGGGQVAEKDATSRGANHSTTRPRDHLTTSFITVATTRPETMLGDTAVAINPKDPRAPQLRGRFVRLPIVNRIVPIIEDDYVVLPVSMGGDEKDPKAQFATGFLKVTPAHDENDWLIGQRHNLPVINVLSPDAKISRDHGWPEGEWSDANSRGANTDKQDATSRGAHHATTVDAFAHELLGLDRYAARKKVVKWFEEQALLEEVKPYRHSVGHSYRSHAPIEPYLSDQWYVDVDKDFGTEQQVSAPAGGVCQGSAIPQNSLAGLALRALAQGFTSRDPGGREGVVDSRAATVRERSGLESSNTYLITFSTYGSWLHGDTRGSVDRLHNDSGTPYLSEDREREEKEFQQLKHPMMKLDAQQRQVVGQVIAKVCEHRQWSLVTGQVRSNHVHVVVRGDTAPERIMIDFKAYATRELRAQRLITENTQLWTRHGSTRYLNDEASILAACEYVNSQEGGDIEGSKILPLPQTGVGHGSYAESKTPLPDGRGSSDQNRSLTVAARSEHLPGKLRLIPDRYERTFAAWHENIRDWCISRQLWWGHRIPVWAKSGQVAEWPSGQVSEQDKQNLAVQVIHDTTYVCLRHDDPVLIQKLEAAGFVQDPDVLDTWFSSALWPISTLGWPNENGNPALQHWNPSSTLCTAREIITLWVSRMVMFNLYFRGCLPFEDVFVHAMIQDGEGRKMSKSLGNGVDPLDIIASHGADALRFTLAQMTTQTQDLRMPVVKDAATGRNSSPKFDLGRNFSNKIWNATRFALGVLEQNAVKVEPAEQRPSMAPPETPGLYATGLCLVDQWILARLAQLVRESQSALEQYEFSRYAQGLYDFFWRDLCDWYIEAIKPTVAQNTTQRAVLLASLDTSLRLMHPVMPFLSETLWAHLNTVFPDRAGLIQQQLQLTLKPSPLLIHADWPGAETFARFADEKAQGDFELVREAIVAIRQVRTQYKVPPRQKVEISAKAPPAIAQKLLPHRDITQTLANVVCGEIGPKVEKPNDAAAVRAAEVEIYLHGLVQADAEKERLQKRQTELQKSIANLQGRLKNPSYVDRAPPALVQQTKDQLAQAEKELALVGEQLQAMGG